MAFRDYLIGALLVALFAVALISFAIQTGYDNNSVNNILNDPTINSTYTSLNNSLNSYQALAEAQRNASVSENPIIGYGTLILYTVVTIPQKFTSIVVNLYNLVLSFLSINLGIPPIASTVIIVIVIITVIFGLFRIWRLGY